jgi:hypothetical protein
MSSPQRKLELRLKDQGSNSTANLEGKAENTLPYSWVPGCCFQEVTVQEPEEEEVADVAER